MVGVWRADYYEVIKEPLNLDSQPIKRYQNPPLGSCYHNPEAQTLHRLHKVTQHGSRANIKTISVYLCIKWWPRCFLSFNWHRNPTRCSYVHFTDVETEADRGETSTQGLKFWKQD